MRPESFLLTMGELPEDQQKEFVDWAWRARSRTTFDPAIIGHARAVMFMACNSGELAAYLPAQTVLMAEAFIPRPGLSPLATAAALGCFDKALSRAARATGIGHVYCYLPEAEIDYANRIEAHGWDEVEAVRLFRKRIN
jgi:hypothetical protein